MAGWLGWLGVVFVASHARGIYESKIFVFQAWARDLGSFWGQHWRILDHLGNLGPPWIFLWATWEQPGTAILGKPSPRTNKSIFMPSHDSWDVFGEHVSGDAGYEIPTKKNQVVDICLDISCHDHLEARRTGRVFRQTSGQVRILFLFANNLQTSHTFKASYGKSS